MDLMPVIRFEDSRKATINLNRKRALFWGQKRLDRAHKSRVVMSGAVEIHSAT